MRLVPLLFVAALVVPTVHAQWNATATQHRGEDIRVTYECPPGGSAHSVWGTDLYTDDSSVCTAAVHAGLLSFASGGRVTILMAGGANRYEASTRNGVSSGSWGPWAGSFRFVGGNAPPPSSSATAATWSTTMTAHRGDNGKRITFSCPAGGPARAVWGTDVYTDDSSVCSAGVHAGAITVASGGDVTVEVMSGRESYSPTTRNGITSRSWGRWSGSFRVVD